MTIIGIGASAGGLAAFEAFFSGMPKDRALGMACVLIQHLAPDHKSLLSELIQRYTSMDVFEVTDGMRVKPNVAYIIPPSHDMEYRRGRLHLLEPLVPRGRHLPIDVFLHSLAADLGSRAVGIILSGTGSDGTAGARAIKGAGGLVIAQSPELAEYDAMPRSVIAAGVVDEVLLPTEMASWLVARNDGAPVTAGVQAETDRASGDDMGQILALVRIASGHDFTGYKPSTVSRRVGRRMAANQLDRHDQYLDLLRTKPEEAIALSNDLLIGVTSFFRDPAAFAALHRLAIAPIVARSRPNDVLRIWVPGCSTGEEAYSIAMLLREEMEAQKRFADAQVFATDIDNRAIDTARAGVYPAGITADVSPDRLTRFFLDEPDSATFRVRRSLRDMVVFSTQNVLSDPPFSRLDLISCRNVMIYMEAGLHEELLATFHYALAPGGFLLLGTSETIGRQQQLFAELDHKARLFKRGEADETPRTRTRMGVGRIGRTPGPAIEPAPDRQAVLRHLIERAILEHDPRVAALVTDRGDILYLHGRTGQFLEPAPGQADLNILRMAREGLRRDLTAALREAVARKVRVTRSDLQVRTNGDTASVDLEVRRVGVGEDSGPPLFVVILDDRSQTQTRTQTRPGPTLVAGPAEVGGPREMVDARVAELESELRLHEEYLRSTVEQLEISNEDLKASNEELQSINEELQSTNEEFETSREELQSVNEELSTVNGELQATVGELTDATDDISNLLESTGVATMFVDLDLRIRRFTPEAGAVLNVIPADVGRPIHHLASNLVGYDRMATDAQAVVDDLEAISVEVQDHAGSWYILGIRPYRTSDGAVDGVVITFTDTTAIKQAQAIAGEVERLRPFAGIVRDTFDAIVVHDLTGRIVAWNPAATRLFGWPESEALTMSILELVNEPERAEALDRILRLTRDASLEPFQSMWRAKDGRTVGARFIATALLDAKGEPYAVAIVVRHDSAEDR